MSQDGGDERMSQDGSDGVMSQDGGDVVMSQDGGDGECHRMTMTGNVTGWR